MIGNPRYCREMHLEIAQLLCKIEHCVSSPTHNCKIFPLTQIGDVVQWERQLWEFECK